MHNRIYQISTIPINPEKYISEINFLEHWFTESITECVNGGLDRNTEIKSFLDLLVSDSIAASNSDDSFTFLPGAFQSKVKRKLKENRGNYIHRKIWIRARQIDRCVVTTVDKVRGALPHSPEFIAFVFLTE